MIKVWCWLFGHKYKVYYERRENTIIAFGVCHCGKEVYRIMR